MKAIPSVLDYLPQRSPPRALAIEEADAHVRVMFAVDPEWAYLFPIILGITLGALKLAFGIIFVVIWYRLVYRTGFPIPDHDVVLAMRRIAGEILTAASIFAIIWWSAAAYLWWKYSRWGRVPRMLTADSRGLVFSRLGWRRMRQTTWPAGDITGIELRPVKRNLNWMRTVAILYIHRRKGRRIHFRLSSKNSELPKRIAQALASRLGCPLL